MATKHLQGSGGPRGDDIPVLDKISCKSELAKVIPALRIAVTVLFATFFHHHYCQAVIYHCQIDNERRTFLKGEWNALGLDDPEAERECHELHGKSLIQCQISPNGTIYVLTQEGVLWTMGDNSLSQLGRSTRNVDPKTFGPVPMTEPILAVASGAAHCLAMTANKVFAFGNSELGQTGVRIGEPVGEPTEIYRGTGNDAPSQVAAGNWHSAILTKGGQIGCTARATFFLADGKMFGCGDDRDFSLGVGHDKITTLLRTDGHIITSFRCSYSLVVAYTELRDALVWGECEDKVIIKGQQVERLEYPRDFFSRGPCKDTGGAVFPDSLVNQLLQLSAEYQASEDTVCSLERNLKGRDESLETSKLREGSLEEDLAASQDKVCRLEQNLKDLTEKLETSKAHKVTVEKDLTASTKKVPELEQNLKDFDKEIESSKALETSLQKDITASKEKVSELEQKCKDLNQELEASNARKVSLHEDLIACKHQLHDLEEQHSQVKETSEQTEQQLLMERTSHGETRLQLQNTRIVQERTQHELEVHRNKLIGLDNQKTEVEHQLRQEKTSHEEIQKHLLEKEDLLEKTQRQLQRDNALHRKTQQQLKTEKTAHENTQERLKQENASHKKTQERLKREKTSHNKSQTLLRKETASHQKTQELLGVETTINKESRQHFESEREARLRIQEELEASRRKLLELEERLSKVTQTHEKTEQQLLMEKASHEATRLQFQNTSVDYERTQQEFEDLRKKMRNMSYVNETLTEKLGKTVEENHALTQEIKSYQENLRSFERHGTEDKGRDVSLLVKLKSFLERENMRLEEQQSTLQYAANVLSEGQRCGPPTESRPEGTLIDQSEVTQLKVSGSTI